MPSRWVRSWRVALSLLLLVTVFGLGLWAGGWNRPRNAQIEFPFLVNVRHSKSGERASDGIEIRDRQTIVFLDTLFPNYRNEAQKANSRARSGSSQLPAAEHFELEFTLAWSGYPKQLVVWSEGDIESWSAGGNHVAAVHGSFRRLMEWLPVRRAVEMAIRPTPHRAIGKKLLTEERERFLDVVIDNVGHQIGNLRFWAVRDLLTLIESSAPRTAHQTGGYPTYQRIDGYLCGPVPADFPRIQEIRELALQMLDSDTGRDETAILALTADEALIEEMARRLSTTLDWNASAKFIICLRDCLGLPEFRRGGMCGNSSPAEFAQFRKIEEQRTNDAKSELLAWLANWKTSSKEERCSAILTAWESEFDRKPNDYDYHFDEHSKRYRNLLRRGSEMLSAVEAAQATAPDLRRRGTLEFFKAHWTGHGDAAVVKELLHGDRQTQQIACDIIAASADVAWKDELAKLLLTPRSPTEPDPPSWSRLLDKVGETLVMCHEAETLPILVEAQKLGHGVGSVHYALQHFQVPQGE